MAQRQIGLKNVPNDPAIVGGVPKVNIQGFDAVGRHTSTPQFQTPRSWNPRATLSWTRGLHFIKFGGEFLHVQTRINDLNATIGRMNFENRFTNRAVGDLLLGLPSQLALTSFTVMDQGQNMQFYFIQDDYKITPKLTLNLGLRYEYATPPIEKNNQFANFDPATGTMIFAKDGGIFDRALIHPDRNNVRAALRLRLVTDFTLVVVRGAYGVFFTHTVRQGREGLLGFNPPFLVDNLLQTGVTGAAAVASAAPFRLVNGYPTGLLDPNSLNLTTVGRRAQDANQRTPYIQQYNFGIQYELLKDLLLDVAYVGNKGTKLNGFRNLNQRAVITNANGSQSAGARPYPRFRRHPVDGEPCRVELQLVADAFGETLLQGLDWTGQLHLGQGADRLARSHLDQRRRRGCRHRHIPRTAGRQQPARRPRAGRIRHQASLRRELHLGTAFRSRAAFR